MSERGKGSPRVRAPRTAFLLPARCLSGRDPLLEHSPALAGSQQPAQLIANAANPRHGQRAASREPRCRWSILTAPGRNRLPNAHIRDLGLGDKIAIQTWHCTLVFYRQEQTAPHATAAGKTILSFPCFPSNATPPTMGKAGRWNLKPHYLSYWIEI